MSDGVIMTHEISALSCWGLSCKHMRSCDIYKVALPGIKCVSSLHDRLHSS